MEGSRREDKGSSRDSRTIDVLVVFVAAEAIERSPTNRSIESGADAVSEIAIGGNVALVARADANTDSHGF